MSRFSYRSSNQRKKTLKYGGYATISIMILLAALILVNVLFSQLGWRVDLTENELYTPSQDTKTILSKLEDDIVIYGFYNQGTDTNELNDRVIKLVREYTDLSDRVSFEKIDPLANPAFANQFLMDDSNSIGNGSLIVQNMNTKKFKTIPLTTMYEVTSDYSTLTQNVTGFSAEEALTSAIQYVSITATPVLYQLQGHSEALLSDDFISYMTSTNFEIKEMNLIRDGITELEANDYTVICVNNPRQDLAQEEYETLLKYMETGGRMLFLATYDTPELPNFSRLLSRYGIGIQTGTMLETDASHYYQYPFIILPTLSTGNDITKYLAGDSNNYVVMTLPAAVTISPEVEAGTKITSLVTTSEGAVFKGENNLGTVYEEGDIQGPFNLAVAVEKELAVDGKQATTKLIVLASSEFIDPKSGSIVTTGNFKLTTIACDYLQDSVGYLYITSKSIEEGKINTTETDFLGYGAIFVILLPAIIIIAGIVIYMRRKRR